MIDIAKLTSMYQAKGTDGKWHCITPVQYAAYKLDGVPVRVVEMFSKKR